MASVLVVDLYAVLVSIRMAKDQNLSLNPTKISGVCGRLMCCLNYEDDLYKKGGDLYVKKERPQVPQDVAPPGIGKEVVTDEGIGKVLKVNHHKHTVKVQLEAGRTIDLKWSEVALPDE